MSTDKTISEVRLANEQTLERLYGQIDELTQTGKPIPQSLLEIIGKLETLLNKED